MNKFIEYFKKKKLYDEGLELIRTSKITKKYSAWRKKHNKNAKRAGCKINKRRRWRNKS